MSKTAETLRLFSAISPDSESLDRMIDLIRSMKREPWAKAVRWLPNENIHLTLRFFGDTPQDQTQALVRALTDAGCSCRPFDLSLDCLIALPSPTRARVIAAGAHGSDALMHLAENVEKAARNLGFAPEKRPFRPHITLGRCKPANLRAMIPKVPVFDGITIPVTGFDLIQSTLSSKGAFYKVIARINVHSDDRTEKQSLNNGS